MLLSKQLVIAVSISITSCLGIQVAQSTTIMKQGFSELVQSSDGILAGTVSSITYEKSQIGVIYTFVRLDRLEVVRGLFSGNAFSLRFEGGELDGEIQGVEGSPNFRVGERVVVMVRGNGDKIVPISGWEQGLFRVYRDPQTGKDVVSDAVGNRIYGIRNGDVIKENQAKTRATVLTHNRGGSVQSDLPSVQIGRTTGGRIIRSSDSALTNTNQSNTNQSNTNQSQVIQMQSSVGSVMSFDTFKQQIDNEASATTAVQFEELISVEPGNTPVKQTLDAGPPTN